MPHKDPDARRAYATEAARRRRTADPEKFAAYHRARNAAKNEEERQKDRERKRARYAANRERFRAEARAFYAANREKCISTTRAWQKAHPEQAQKNRTNWVEENPERAAYKAHKGSAKQRDVPFVLTFEEWFTIWQESGKWQQRGARRGQYCMARYGDLGPYAVGNVRICLNSENAAERNKGQTGKKISHRGTNSVLRAPVSSTDSLYVVPLGEINPKNL